MYPSIINFKYLTFHNVPQGDVMKIADIDVDDEVLAEYIEKVRHMIEKGKEMPIGVSLGYMDSEREELHDKILDVHNQSRGSAFDIALREHVEDIGSKEGWFMTWGIADAE